MEQVLESLMTTAFVTSGMFLVDAYRKEKKTFGRYAFQFSALFIIFYTGDVLFHSRVEATNFTRRNDSVGYFDDHFLDELDTRELSHRNKLEHMRHEFYQNQMPIPHEKRVEYHKKMVESFERGKKYYKRAEELAMWYLPTLDEEQAAEYCWDAGEAAAGVAILKSAPISAAILVILRTTTTYAKHCSKQWREMQSYLQASKCEFETAEFCCECIYGDTNVKKYAREKQPPIYTR